MIHCRIQTIIIPVFHMTIHLQGLDFLQQGAVAVPLEHEAPLRLLELHDHTLRHRDRQTFDLDNVPEREGLAKHENEN